MSHFNPFLRRSASAWCAGVAATLLAAVITACGGGGGDAPASPGSAERATAFAEGPISGFGSVIVNGVRFNDDAAQVEDEDGAAHTRGELRLGMMVQVDGRSLDKAQATGHALRIRFGGQVLGPVDSVNIGAGTLVVLGQNVDTTATTVFGEGLTGGLAGLTANTVIEVHGLLDAATGHILATRIHAAANAPAFKLRAKVAALDRANKTFRLGSALIGYAAVNAANLPANLADDLPVAVRLQTAQVNGQWVASGLRSAQRQLEDRADSHLRGSITAFTSTTSFQVNGIAVNAANASFPDGTAGLLLGAQVEVEGALSNGVLVATKVELDERHALERHRLELHGAVSAVDTAARTFSLRGVTVRHAATTTWKNGDAAKLIDGAKVEVKGLPSLHRSVLEAAVIGFE